MRFRRSAGRTTTARSRSERTCSSTRPRRSRSRWTCAGRWRCDLFAASSARDADWATKVLAVRPDGFALRLNDGIVRARFRQGREKEVPLEPGRVENYEIDNWSTCIRLGVGWRAPPGGRVPRVSQVRSQHADGRTDRQGSDRRGRGADGVPRSRSRVVHCGPRCAGASRVDAHDVRVRSARALMRDDRRRASPSADARPIAARSASRGHSPGRADRVSQVRQWVG